MRKNIEAFRNARRLRRKGMSVTRIAAAIGVSKTSAYAWTADISRPIRFTAEYRHQNKLRRLEQLADDRARRRACHLNASIINSNGYRLVRAPIGYQGTTNTGIYVYEHRLVAERSLGRLLACNEVVHHINGNRLDNRPDNLSVMTNSAHSKSHCGRGPTLLTTTCMHCGIVFSYRKGKARSFCSRRCVGLFNFPAKVASSNLAARSRIQWRTNRGCHGGIVRWV